jgi:hypothetical protein
MPSTGGCGRCSGVRRVGGGAGDEEAIVFDEVAFTLLTTLVQDQHHFFEFWYRAVRLLETAYSLLTLATGAKRLRTATSPRR